MDELKKVLDIAVTGTIKEQALEAFEQQLKKWHIVMPPSERIVLDFGLGDFYTTGLIECWIANEVSAGYCGKFLFVFEGQTCPMHRHEIKHETFYILHGSVLMRHDDKEFTMNSGDTLSVSLKKFHSFTGINGPALLIEISKPCFVQDNFFSDRHIPIGGNYQGSSVK